MTSYPKVRKSRFFTCGMYATCVSVKEFYSVFLIFTGSMILCFSISIAFSIASICSLLRLAAGYLFLKGGEK